MKKLILIIGTLACCLGLSAQEPASGYPEGPGLEFVVELNVELGATYTVGQTSRGVRMVVPITGGTFEGPGMKGEVLNGGADYQLHDTEHGRTEIEAIYSIKTDDGVYIHIRNCGIIKMGGGENGAPSFYFRMTPKFEAPQDSKYNWLNDAIFVCQPGMGKPGGGICLHVWKVL